MDWSHLIALFLVQAHEGVGVLDAIHKVAATLNHTLVDQLLEWLFLHTDAQVIQELVPESAVDEVTSSMFTTTYIQVHILPVFSSLF